MLKLKDPVCVGGRNTRLGDQTRGDEQDRAAPETWPTFQVASSWEVLPSRWPAAGRSCLPGGQQLGGPAFPAHPTCLLNTEGRAPLHQGWDFDRHVSGRARSGESL